ncbi:MAG: RND transporter, partial [Mesorhizobium sp.]
MTGLERGSVAARRLLAPMITAVLLAGCVVGPDYQTPILAMPASWSGQKPTKPVQPAQLSKWWQRLRDPELNTLVEEA